MRGLGLGAFGGLLLLFVDNSNFQVDDDQLEFTRLQLASAAGRRMPATGSTSKICNFWSFSTPHVTFECYSHRFAVEAARTE